MFVHSFGDAIRVDGFALDHFGAIHPDIFPDSVSTEGCSDVVDGTSTSVAVGHDGTSIVLGKTAAIAVAAGVDPTTVALVRMIRAEVMAKFCVIKRRKMER